MAGIVFKKDFIAIDIDVKTQDEAFEILARPLDREGIVKPGFLQGIRQREDKFPTGLPTIPFGVAIPHTDPQYVKQNAMSLGILKSPIAFGVMGSDNEQVDVRIIFLLALNEAQKQLNMLREITSIIKNEEVLSSLLGMNKHDIFEVFQTKLRRIVENE